MNYCDTREPQDILNKLCAYPDWEKKFLDTGDYLISTDHNIIGVERKTWSDLLMRINPKSREDNIRPLSLKDQLYNMTKDYNVIILLVEGWCGVTWQGNIKMESRESGFTYVQVQHYLLGIQECGVRIITAPNIAETVRELTTLGAFYSKPRTSELTIPSTLNMSVQELMLSAIPKLGYQKAKALALKYPTMESLLSAQPRDLQCIEGIGKTLSERILGVLHGNT